MDGRRRNKWVIMKGKRTGLNQRSKVSKKERRDEGVHARRRWEAGEKKNNEWVDEWMEEEEEMDKCMIMKGRKLK